MVDAVAAQPISSPPLSAAEQIRNAVVSSASYRRFSDDDLGSVFATAKSFMGAGRFDKAMSMLLVCAMYRPHEPKYLTALGVCHRRLGQHEMAVQAFALATSMDPMHYDAALQAAECLLRLRRHDDARQVLRALVDCGSLTEDAAPQAARAKVLLELAVPEGAA